MLELCKTRAFCTCFLNILCSIIKIHSFLHIGFEDFLYQFFFLNLILFYFFKDFIYSGETEREREAETQAEGEAGSMQGARCGT